MKHYRVANHQVEVIEKKSGEKHGPFWNGSRDFHGVLKMLNKRGIRYRIAACKSSRRHARPNKTVRTRPGRTPRRPTTGARPASYA